jgi:hypothetical protein
VQLVAFLMAYQMARSLMLRSCMRRYTWVSKRYRRGLLTIASRAHASASSAVAGGPDGMVALCYFFTRRASGGDSLCESDVISTISLRVPAERHRARTPPGSPSARTGAASGRWQGLEAR